VTGVYDGCNDISFGLDLILDGLERSLPGMPASAQSARDICDRR
jgi:hypothetical protein